MSGEVEAAEEEIQGGDRWDGKYDSLALPKSFVLKIVPFNKHELATIGEDTHRMTHSVHCMLSCCDKSVFALNHPASQVDLTWIALRHYGLARISLQQRPVAYE